MADIVCKGAALLCDVVWVSVRLLLELPVAVVRCAAFDAGIWRPAAIGCAFYEGYVQHIRSKPLRHTFRSRSAAIRMQGNVWGYHIYSDTERLSCGQV